MTRGTPIPAIVTLHVPFRLVKRGGRKEMHLPDGAAQPRKADNTLVKALARAFRWKRMLDSGEFTTVAEIASHESISFTYISRVLRLGLLSPDIVEAILAGHQPAEMALAELMEPFPLDWVLQQAKWPIDAATENVGLAPNAVVRGLKSKSPD
ncbi:hypothetical protein [Aurantimonas sp. VKM B-3413]|uniref:hypothetical protein n=1 Tax=Aurantimonas sp. VKM B-3413 TaxID=2779401 RepID=UPI001E3795CE|nr:hypothetical protein [Aurantimonas sp. VKM B-3413]MCB8836172.1 hypothetical protein [Aurantimonas sp. VKM B-3413]